MKTIKKEIINEIVINKSRFITIITNVYNTDDVNEKMKSIKKDFKGATHYCFAYIINGYQKCSDDKEPSGTAGVPILNVLKANDLNYVLCVVVRYFGGVKLGAGGLVRAYSSSVKEALDKGEFGDLIPGYKIVIEFDYDYIKNIDHILKDIDIIKSYETKVVYEFQVTTGEYDSLKDSLNKYSSLRSIEDITIVKGD